MLHKLSIVIAVLVAMVVCLTAGTAALADDFSTLFIGVTSVSDEDGGMDLKLINRHHSSGWNEIELQYRGSKDSPIKLDLVTNWNSDGEESYRFGVSYPDTVGSVSLQLNQYYDFTKEKTRTQLVGGMPLPWKSGRLSTCVGFMASTWWDGGAYLEVGPGLTYDGGVAKLSLQPLIKDGGDRGLNIIVDCELNLR